VWSEGVRDSRLPGRWGPRLSRNRAGRALRQAFSPVQPLWWLASGTPADRIGYAPGPLLALRRRRQARLSRPIRLCLLEGPSTGRRFSPALAYWINERSQVVHAVVDDPAEADVVWVHTQDPLTAPVRAWLDTTLAAVDVPVLNRPERYDAYHLAGTFALLRDAGVPVPDPEPAIGDLVVVKGPGQMSAKSLQRLVRPLPAGHRAFSYVDARNGDGMHRRYRAFCLLGTVHAGDVIASSHWEVGLRTLEQHQPTFCLTPAEEQAVRRIGQLLDLDWFCVDFVRRAGDGSAVVTDINVYPSVVVSEAVDAALGARGRWHFLDTAERMRVPEPQGPFWPKFDAAFTELVSSSRGPRAEAAGSAVP